MNKGEVKKKLWDRVCVGDKISPPRNSVLGGVEGITDALAEVNVVVDKVILPMGLLRCE